MDSIFQDIEYHNEYIYRGVDRIEIDCNNIIIDPAYKSFSHEFDKALTSFSDLLDAKVLRIKLDGTISSIDSPNRVLEEATGIGFNDEGEFILNRFAQIHVDKTTVFTNDRVYPGPFQDMISYLREDPEYEPFEQYQHNSITIYDCSIIDNNG